MTWWPPTQRQIYGVLFLVFGAWLTAWVAPAISDETKQINFEQPPDPSGFGLSPPLWVTVIGLLFVGAGLVALAEQYTGRWSTIGLVVAAASFVPLVIVLGLALGERSGTNVTNLAAASLSLTTPVALGAMAGLWSERSGVVNIGIEGMMLSGAGVGFMTYALLGDANSRGWLVVAILVAVLAGGLIAALHAALSVSLQIDQIISGVVINLLALGLTGFLRSEVIVPHGVSSGTTTGNISIPLLSDIPVIGDQLFVGKPIYWSMYIIIALTGFVLWRTPWGLRVRSCGENPHAAETLGVDVIRTRYAAVITGGLIAGLAGAWFTLEKTSRFDDAVTNGAGFIALAALIFGKWRPWPAFAGALLFGFAEALQTRLQILGVEVNGFAIPSQFLQALPFVVTIVVVAGAVGRATAPAAVGQPYERSS